MTTLKKSSSLPNHLVLFDGICNLCATSVQTMIKMDKKGLLKFASLQSNIGQELLQQYELPTQSFKSFLYIKNGQLFTKSDAALQIGMSLGGFWNIAYVGLIIPKFIRDGIYSTIAKNRYKWFGKKDQCMMPTPELRERFV